MTRRASARRQALGALAACSMLASAGALAQRFDPNKPLTFTVGAPPGIATADRVDARRSGFARTLLPTGTLRVAWHHALSQDTETAPLVLADGSIVLLTTRGEAVTMSSDGDERLHVSLGLGAPGPGAVLSDGTLVLVDFAGEAIGIKGDTVSFRTRVAERGIMPKAAPLALEDGGVVVAAGAELVALDARGELRARATLSETVAWPLVSAIGKVVAVAPSGTVYAWSPGREPTRVGSFGGSVEGGAAAADDRTLIAVVGGTHLAALDLIHGVLVTRAMATGGVWLGPAALRGTTAVVLGLTPANVVAVAVDPTGQELERAIIETFPTAPPSDGGAPPWVAPSRTPILVDAAGTIAFETPDTHVGVVTATGAVETLGDIICTRDTPRRTQAQPGPSRTGRVLAGMSPAGPGAFVVACGAEIAKISGETNQASQD